MRTLRVILFIVTTIVGIVTVCCCFKPETYAISLIGSMAFSFLLVVCMYVNNPADDGEGEGEGGSWIHDSLR